MFFGCKKGCKNHKILKINIYCREEGIRTLDMLPYTRFPSVRLQPLGHLSFYVVQIKE